MATLSGGLEGPAVTAHQRPRFKLYYGRGVQGVARFRGLGQPDPTATDTTTVSATMPVVDETWVDSSTGISYGIDSSTGTIYNMDTGQVALGSASTVTPTAGAGGATPSTSGSGFNLTSFLNNLISTAGKATQTALSPYSALAPGTTVYSTPSGTLVSTAGSAGTSLLSSLNLSSTLSSLLPVLLIGGAVILVFSLVEKK